MDENKLKEIVEEVVNRAVDPIKEDLNEVKGDLAGIKETQEDHTRRLEALAGDTEQLLMDVKGIRDKEGMAHLDLPLVSDIPEI